MPNVEYWHLYSLEVEYASGIPENAQGRSLAGGPGGFTPGNGLAEGVVVKTAFCEPGKNGQLELVVGAVEMY